MFEYDTFEIRDVFKDDTFEIRDVFEDDTFEIRDMLEDDTFEIRDVFEDEGVVDCNLFPDLLVHRVDEGLNIKHSSGVVMYMYLPKKGYFFHTFFFKSYFGQVQ